MFWPTWPSSGIKNHFKKLRKINCNNRGPGSSVNVVTAYGLDGLGIESRWGWDFPHLSRPALRSNQPPVQWVPSLTRGG